MRRSIGMGLIVIAAVVAVIGAVLGVQMVGHTAWWQVLVLVALVLALAWQLLRVGRRMRS